MWEVVPVGMWITYAALAGLAIGSFINVVVHRLPKMMEMEWEDELTMANGKEPAKRPRFDLIVPRSRCPHCETPIRFFDNIPLLSWLLLRGKCRHCAKPISPRYPLVELVCSALFATIAYLNPQQWQALWLMGLASALVCLALIDLDAFLLPDSITLPLVWVGLIYQLIFQPSHLPSAVIGAIAGYLILWLVYHAFKLATGKEGMGYGDFKLLAAAGAWFGYQSLLTVLLVSSVGGVFFGLTIQALRKQDRSAAFPFGPAIVFGMFAWMFGLDVVSLLQ